MNKLIAIASLVVLAAACNSQPDYRAEETPPQTVGYVDLQRYAGLWYEIARYPNSFEEGCAAVTAEYTPLPDGDIEVRNTCREGSPDGPEEVAVGRAWAVDDTNAKLKVKFAPSWVPFAAGDYWILALDKEYKHVLVGDPSGKYLWILARTPTISTETLNAYKQAAAQRGYDSSKLEMVEQ